MSGPGFERTSDMTAAINGVVEDTAFDIAERR
jgi:hypothetical protein